MSLNLSGLSIGSVVDLQNDVTRLYGRGRGAPLLDLLATRHQSRGRDLFQHQPAKFRREIPLVYLPATRDALDQIEQITVRMERLSHSRALVADVLPTFAMRWLVPRLAMFNDENPDIEIHILTSIEPADFERDDVDVAIRVGTPPGTPVRRYAGTQAPAYTSKWR